MKQAPILVTGAPRSGTTFLGRMLALPYHVLYVDEPFNVQTGLEGVRTMFPDKLTSGGLANGDGDAEYADFVRKLLRGEARFRPSELRVSTKNPLRQLARELWVSRENLGYKLHAKNPLKQRYLLKDPMACYLTEYLHRNFDMKTIIIMRHPLSTIASYKRLGWHYNVADLLKRTEHMGVDLKRTVQELEAGTLNEMEEWSYMWLCIYAMLHKFLKANPGMLLVTHEELSVRPVETLESLYRSLGMPFTERVRQKIVDHTKSENPTEPTGNKAHVLRRNSAENINRWRHILTSKEIDTIHRITAPFVGQFYSASSWD
ncbi:MAG TPA: sulfotransferase [Candidatus Saccharimonadales bacterium]|nr:sulfotransferase [Candidatus Saccharimonadales bacterium]